MDKRAVIVAAFCMTLTGCGGCSRVSPGHVGVKSTLAGTGRGLSDVAVGPAWVTYNPFTESIMEYPTYVQTAVWTKNKDEGHPVNEEISFQTKDKMQVYADISLAYSLQAERVPAFYLKFRTDDLDTFTHGFLRNLAREKFDNVAGSFSVDEVMGDNAPFLAAVRGVLQKELDPYGVHLEQFGFIGAPRPPDVWAGANAERVRASQLAIQKQNEVLQAQADAQKRIAEAEGQASATLKLADAQAEANRKLAASITPTLVEYRKLDKWDGHLPQVQSGAGGIIVGLPQGK